MINEISSHKISLKHEKPSSAPKAQVTQSSKPAASAPAAVTRSAASLAANAGLPADKLSASIVSFARFFSLSLKPAMLAAIRQQAFSQALPQSAANNASAGEVSNARQTTATDLKNAAEILKTRETLSLAAAAAESKGVELNPKGLEAYSEAIDPERLKWQGGDRQRDRRKRNQNEQAEKDSIKTESITADKLKKMSLDYMEENPLLEILNKLPGKNGQRWIVLPFDFYDNEKHFKITIRILLDEKNISGVKMAIQVAINSEQGNDNGMFEKRRLFVLDSADNKIVRVIVYLQNEMTEKERIRLKKELADTLGIPVKSISVKYSGIPAGCGDFFPCEAGCDEQIPVIDKAV